MTDKIKMIVAASCGAVGGAVAGFAVTYIVSRKKEKKAVEGALEAQRGLYEGYIAKKGESKEEIQNDGGHYDVEKTSADSKSVDGIARKMDVNRTNYASKSSDNDLRNIIDENRYGPGLDGGSESEYRAGPYIISEIQYSEERLTYDKVTCNYFEPDGILLNEEEEEYEPMDITRDVSWANLEEFSKDGELEELYVRNDNQSTDYFIRRVRHHVEDVEK